MRSLVLVVALLTAACSSGPGIVDTGRVKVVGASELPAPTREDLNPIKDDRLNLIGPRDVLAINVYGIQDLSFEQITVDGNGQLSLPLAGVVQASGKTPAELSEEVAQKLHAGGVREPQVSISVKENNSQVVTVDGEVRHPGNFPIAGRTTMLRAIARAEGTGEAANTEHVVVFRTVNNQRMAALYDLRAIRLGAYEDPEIYPNDVVVVGESTARRIFPVILQSVGVLLTPIVYLLR